MTRVSSPDAVRDASRGEHAHGPRVHDDGSTTFRVWAPKAGRVEVALHDGDHPLDPVGGGWWSVAAPVTHGDDYGFRLDGDERVLPDPASRWQPDGVHGRSRVLDPRRFEWPSTERSWRAPPLAGGVIYELHVGAFTPERTFAAVAEHLPALADLGVTHVEVMPVAAYSGERGWGYDGVDWFAVHEPYGGPFGFAAFVAACHQAGLAVILDVVYNHLGPTGNYLPEYAPYMTDRYVTPWGQALNLDGPDSDPVRALVVENAVEWTTAYRVDGLRLDAVHWLIDTSATSIVAELTIAYESASVHQRRPLQLIAETDRADPATIRPREAGGAGVDAQWADDLHHAIHRAVTGETDGYYADYHGLPDVAEAYRRGFLFDGHRYSAWRGRTAGAPLGDVPGHRLVVCIQNHDQVGNRAHGERLTVLVGPDLVRVAITLLCAAPMTPMLFMGEEYGEVEPFAYFTSHPEPELAEAVRQGRREEFAAFEGFADHVPDPQAPATAARSTLDWSRHDTPEGRARTALWSDLLALRRRHRALGNGRRDFVEVVEAHARRLAVVRHDPLAPAVLLLANLDDEPARWDMPGDWRLLLNTDDVRYGGPGAPESPSAPGGSGATGSPPRSATLWVNRP